MTTLEWLRVLFTGDLPRPPEMLMTLVIAEDGSAIHAAHFDISELPVRLVVHSDEAATLFGHEITRHTEIRVGVKIK